MNLSSEQISKLEVMEENGAATLRRLARTDAGETYPHITITLKPGTKKVVLERLQGLGIPFMDDETGSPVAIKAMDALVQAKEIHAIPGVSQNTFFIRNCRAATAGEILMYPEVSCLTVMPNTIESDTPQTGSPSPRTRRRR